MKTDLDQCRAGLANGHQKPVALTFPANELRMLKPTEIRKFSCPIKLVAHDACTSRDQESRCCAARHRGCFIACQFRNSFTNPVVELRQIDE